MNLLSELGYRDGSPFRNRSHIDINSPEGLIDMSQTGIPLMGVDETGYSKMMAPYSGTHKFRGRKVREVPMQMGGRQIYDFMYEDEDDEDLPVTAPSESDVMPEQAPQQQQQPQGPSDEDLAWEVYNTDSPSNRTYRGTSGRGPVANVEANTNAQFAFNYFQSKGISQAASAGIVGNLMQESQLNPYAKGDNGKATGVAQWHPDRFKSLKSWADSNKRDPFNLETQLDYIVLEANQRGDLARLSKTSDPGEAAFLFAKHYERPKVIDNKRIAYARALRPKRKGGVIK